MTGQLAIDGVDTLPSDRRSGLSQWFTRPVLAKRIVQWCGDIRSMSILEPSAGSGAFVHAIKQTCSSARVVAHELDPEWAAYLRTATDAKVHEGNYLAAPHPGRRYDLTILNPPYENGQDVAFVRKAMDESRRVVALLRSAVLHGKGAYAAIWDDDEWGVVSVAAAVGRWSFDGPVDGTARHDFCAVKLRRGYAGPTHLEWWS